MRTAITANRQGDIAIVTIDREHRLNALDDELIASFVAVFQNLNRKEPIPRAAVLQGAGDVSFCSGYDLNCIDPEQSAEEPFPDERFEKVILAVETSGFPVIASLNGNAFGGGLDLALACDLRLAGPKVKLAMTPARLGLVYSKSGTARFVRKLGPNLTGRLFLTASPMDAKEALRLGIIDGIVGHGNVLKRALEIAGQIAQYAPLAVRGTRMTIRAVAAELPEGDAAWDEIDELRKRALRSQDLKSALTAFATKERPRFQGR